MREIPLTQGKVALVDDEDYERLAAFKWYARYRPDRDHWCAQRNIGTGSDKRTPISMHREILGLSPGDGLKTDHRNGDGLNNRRGNLRVATDSQNQANGKLRRTNCSGFRGVYWNKRRRAWHARIGMPGARQHLGYFNNPLDAADAYLRAAERHFGDFAFHRRDVEGC